MNKHKAIIYSCFLALIIGPSVFSCQKSVFDQSYNPLLEYPADTLLAVVVSPLGTDIDYFLDLSQADYIQVMDTLENQVFPGNFGFIHRNSSIINDMSFPLKTIVLGETLPKRMPLGIDPIGMVQVTYPSQKSIRYLVANPSGENQKEVQDFTELITTKDQIKFDVTKFLQNYGGPNKVASVRWFDEVYAKQVINKYFKNEHAG